MKTVIAVAALVALSTPSFAQGNTKAKNMADYLKGGGGAGGVAATVSGGGNGGWGNVGSAALSGGQVSSRPAR